ncbi:MAG: HAD-IIIC family phosphatase [Acidobacteriia bacterium]|nr:HAD-IIIC family phosphatase [Terriglobia bacterium]
MGNHEDMERVLSRRFRSLEGPARLKLAREILEGLGSRFDADVCALLVEELHDVGDPLLAAWLDTLPASANGAWIETQLRSDNAALVSSWERFFSFQARRDPFDLLAWARALAGTGAYEESAQKLRLAMAQDVHPTFFARAEKLVRQLSGSVRSNLRQCKLAVLGSSTTNLLVPILQALCLRDRIEAEIYEGPYGSIEQQIWDDKSGLTAFGPNIVMLVMHWRDLDLDAAAKSPQAWIDQFIEERKVVWKRLSDLFACHIVQPSFDYPASDAYGHLAAVLTGGRTRVIDLLNLRLREEAPPNVSILNSVAAQREVGAKRWEDPSAWFRYRQHPAPEGLPELAEAYISHVRAVLGLSRKVLVTDLDNTLWNGVIGEDGLDGIGLGPGSPEGEAHLNFQQYMLDLKSRGILLAVCSKNNPEDAQLPFLRHPHMALRLDDFAAFRANWDDKAANLRVIARDLSLGLDSFVFVDDNPLECEWVRSQIPEVTVVDLGSSPFHYVRKLDRGRYFEALSLSKEDLVRADQYRVEAQREGLRASAASLDDFLQKLQLEAAVEEVTKKNLARVTQLVNKTNQFNVTTRRYTEAQMRTMAEDQNGWVGVFQMSDRMGSYGLIGVLCCRPADRGETWEIDTWLMSCRTLGRQMEKFMFDRLVEAAIQRRIRRLIGLYRPTAKNGLVKELYDQMGFRRVAEDSEEVRYELDVPAKPIVTATHVRNVSAITAGAER